MSEKPKPIPNGYAIVPTSITIKNALEALEFYKKAFDAEVAYTVVGENNKLAHGEFFIGDTRLLISDEFPEWGSLSPLSVGGCPMTLAIRTEDCDAAIEKAVAAGAKAMGPAQNMFWGDRTGAVMDPYGYKWSLSTHIEDVSPEEITKRMKAFEMESK